MVHFRDESFQAIDCVSTDKQAQNNQQKINKKHKTNHKTKKLVSGVARMLSRAVILFPFLPSPVPLFSSHTLLSSLPSLFLPFPHFSSLPEVWSWSLAVKHLLKIVEILYAIWCILVHLAIDLLLFSFQFREERPRGTSIMV